LVKIWATPVIFKLTGFSKLLPNRRKFAQSVFIFDFHLEYFVVIFFSIFVRPTKKNLPALVSDGHPQKGDGLLLSCSEMSGAFILRGQLGHEGLEDSFQIG
jgi:hypothetical protein